MGETLAWQLLNLPGQFLRPYMYGVVDGFFVLKSGPYFKKVELSLQDSGPFL